MGVSTLPQLPGFFHAILRVLGQNPGGLRRRDIHEPVADMLELTPEQRAERLPSGAHLRYRHRIGWSLSTLKAAGYVEERIDSAVKEIEEAVARELLDRIAQAPPVFFEELVLDLLHKLGYGTSTTDLQRLGGAGDAGIDGVISLDKLGFEKVYIQAKRWQGSIGRPEVQGFFGALAGRRAKKGVFITTSSFTKEARDYGEQVSENVVLIGGARLTSLMIEYGVGVTHYREVRLPRIDGDYFE